MKISNNITFGNNHRSYLNKQGKAIGTHTYMFRNDLKWELLAKYEKESFKNKDKVNIVQFAASDGSEAYTKIISLMEANCGDKFYPIKSYDMDSEIIQAAKSGLLKVNDLDELQQRVTNFDKYFEKTDKKLIIKNDNSYTNNVTLKVLEPLTGRVEFNKGDMFKLVKNIEDNHNTILLCRNVLAYFSGAEIEEFIKNASSVLKGGSLFVIGEVDTVCTNIRGFMEKHNFRKVIENVYEKL